jgi:hypothetical protein
MSEVITARTFRKLRYTPLGDLLRGQISGRLDVMQAITASSLPAEAKQLVCGVVKRTRLWPAEKVDVANELISHFADGLQAGAAVEELIQQFGNERVAARLIRRAKKRARPLPWHILRAIGWLTALLLIVYSFIALRFVVSRPSPKLDYLAAINQPTLGAPEPQRAWPIYRKALLMLGPREYSKEAEVRLVEILDAQPGGAHWDKVAPSLAAHAQTIELAREAAQKPNLGFILGRTGSVNDPELYPGTKVWAKISPQDAALVTIPLPHLNDLSLLAHVLSLDARFAQEQSDPDRVMRDIDALLRLAGQLSRDGEFLVVNSVGLSIGMSALDAAEASLLHPRLRFSDQDLQRLAHLLARPKLAGDLLKLTGERAIFHDVIQRCYTDDGNGDGRLTLQGQQLLAALAPVAPTARRGLSEVYHDLFIAALRPVTAASRRETIEQYNHLLDLADSNFRLPLREAKWDAYENDVPAMISDSDRSRRPLVDVMSRNLSYAQTRAERYLGRRDGIVAAIAIELYRRKTNQHPPTLDALVPEYLPAVPEDRIDGKPLRYRLIDGRPVIYSVGEDQDDDGGTPPKWNRIRQRPQAARWMISKEKAVDGDWILFPKPPSDTDRPN